MYMYSFLWLNFLKKSEIEFILIIFCCSFFSLDEDDEDFGDVFETAKPAEPDHHDMVRKRREEEGGCYIAGFILAVDCVQNFGHFP